MKISWSSKSYDPRVWKHPLLWKLKYKLFLKISNSSFKNGKEEIYNKLSKLSNEKLLKEKLSYEQFRVIHIFQWDKETNESSTHWILNFQLKLPQIQKIMMEFEKQSEIMDMKEEMMSDAIDDAMGDEDDEEERWVVNGISVGGQNWSGFMLLILWNPCR